MNRGFDIHTVSHQLLPFIGHWHAQSIIDGTNTVNLQTNMFVVQNSS